MSIETKMEKVYTAGQVATTMGIDSYMWQGKYERLWDDLGENPFHPDPALEAAFAAGQAGSEMPTRVRAWRYGDIPENGLSYNAQDDCHESGCSVMAVYGGEEIDDKTAGWFYRAMGLPRIEITGWLITHTYGGDGEPLLAGARVTKYASSERK